MNEVSMKTTIFQWLSRALGKRHARTITFSSDFVEGNQIKAAFNSVEIDTVNYTVKQSTTLQLLAFAIQETGEVWQAVVTGARQITVYGYTPGDNLSITDLSVIGGLTHPSATIATVTEPEIYKAFWDFQGAPRPGLYPYADMKLDSIRKIGFDEIRMKETDPLTLLTTVGGQRVLTVMLNFYGQTPMQDAMNAYTSLGCQTTKNFFARANLAILDRLAVQNTSIALETNFDLRASLDFYLGFADNQLDNVGVIEKAEIGGTVNETRNIEDFIVGN